MTLKVPDKMPIISIKLDRGYVHLGQVTILGYVGTKDVVAVSVERNVGIKVQMSCAAPVAKPLLAKLQFQVSTMCMELAKEIKENLDNHEAILTY